MPRSPTDATRFTATGPHMSSKPSASTTPSFTSSPSIGTRLNLPTSAPPANESAGQKIARLRAAAAAAKSRQNVDASSVDRMVRIGRVVADKAHRYTAFGLMGFTLLAAMVATAGVTDMLLHNRRRKQEWLADKEAETARLLAEAKAAVEQGREVTDDQRLLINRERAAREAEEEKRRRPGVLGGIFGGKPVEETKAFEGDSFELASRQSVVAAVGENVESRRRQGERIEEVVKPSGGPLDRQAQLVYNGVSSAGRRWTDWVMGRS